MHAERIDALGVSTALSDACQQLRVPRTQARELLAPQVLLNRHCRGSYLLFRFRVRELLEGLSNLGFQGFQFQGFEFRRFEFRGWRFRTFGVGCRTRLRRCWSGRSWAIAIAPWAANARVVGRWRNRRLRFENFWPVEVNIWVVFFDPADGVLVQGGTTDLDAWRRAKPVKNALPRPPVAAAGMDKRSCFVPAFVAGEPQNWQSYLRLADFPVFLPDFAAGFLFPPVCLAVALAEAGLAEALAAVDFVFALGLTDRAAGAGAL